MMVSLFQESKRLKRSIISFILCFGQYNRQQNTPTQIYCPTEFLILLPLIIRDATDLKHQTARDIPFSYIWTTLFCHYKFAKAYFFTPCLLPRSIHYELINKLEI